MKTYDAIIIGSGQAGNPLANALAAAGRTVAVIEREHVGGTCVNVGCIPKKLFHYSAHLGQSRKDISASGWDVDTTAQHNWKKMTEGALAYIK